MKQMAKLAVVVLMCMGFLAACNTIAGAGKDIKRAGEKIEGAAGS
ncbi:entericidin A/B family lipoprotein [Thermomonas sp.]|nr:entericidin A/B family lipoprotein [Thermomonas sp.]MBZ0087062.1 entericidin A/B family lipoprotein [Thermomonas sp.]MCO5055495.1 entericidin A/B family lipoprotein [Thermomonas sp.]HRO62640.1 entericidin A/B family lipoprotein [Thermomonas sp.]